MEKNIGRVTLQLQQFKAAANLICPLALPLLASWLLLFKDTYTKIGSNVANFFKDF